MNFDHGKEMMSSELVSSFESQNSEKPDDGLNVDLCVTFSGGMERLRCSFLNLSSNRSLSVDNVSFKRALEILARKIKGEALEFIAEIAGQTIRLGPCEVYVYGESGGICSLSLDPVN